MKILFVSYAFPPVSSPGAVRIERLSHYLHVAGHAVTVLTCGNPYSSMISRKSGSGDHSWPFEVIRARDLIDKSSFSGTSRSKRKVTWKGRAANLLASMIFPDRNVSWIPSAIKSARQLSGRVDVIVATFPSASNLVVGAALARKFRVPYVIDFRDLWTESDAFLEKGIVRRLLEYRLETWVAKRCAGVTVVNKNDALVIRNDRRFSHVNITTVYNGYDFGSFVPSAETAGQQRRFTIAYAGSFYGGERDPTSLFKAIGRLISEGVVNREEFSVRIFGNAESFVVNSAMEFSLGDIIEFVPMLDRSELYNELNMADLLLAITRTGVRSRGELTTKLFEYIGMGGEILCLSKPGFEIDELLKGVDGAACLDVGEVDQIYLYLKSQICAWRSRGQVRRKYARGLKFTRRESAGAMESALLQLKDS